MWERPCVVSMGLMFFGVRAVFSMDACHVFPQCMLDVIPLIGGVTGVVVTRACTGYQVPPVSFDTDFNYTFM